MRISAKADSAMRAMLELAGAEDPPLKREDAGEEIGRAIAEWLE